MQFAVAHDRESGRNTAGLGLLPTICMRNQLTVPGLSWSRLRTWNWTTPSTGWSHGMHAPVWMCRPGKPSPVSVHQDCDSKKILGSGYEAPAGSPAGAPKHGYVTAA